MMSHTSSVQEELMPPSPNENLVCEHETTPAVNSTILKPPSIKETPDMFTFHNKKNYISLEPMGLVPANKNRSKSRNNKNMV